MRVQRFALRRIRERSGLSASELARRARISHGTILDIESGRRNGSPSMLKRIAAALKVELVDILADPEELQSDAPPSDRRGTTGSGGAGTKVRRTIASASEHDVLNWLTAHLGARELIDTHGGALAPAQRGALQAIANAALERLRAHGVEPEPPVAGGPRDVERSSDERSSEEG